MFASKDRFLTNATGSYSIARSVRTRSSASAYFNRTFTTSTSSTIWTWSAWVKRGGLTGTYRLFGASTSTYLTFNSSDQLNLTLNGTSAATSTAVFRDPSAWYHVVYQQNGSAQTIYVNNSSVATGTTAAAIFNTSISHQIGAANTTNYFDGYLTEINFIDGQALTPSSFGAINSYGVWAPTKYTGTYGNNGFYLNFSDNSGATATTIGKDYSGNGNNWTPNNISVTSGATYDSMIDTPTPAASATQPVGNYCVMNPLDRGSSILTNGNLKFDNNGSYLNFARANFGVSAGKWYWEYKTTTASANNYALNGITTLSVALGTDVTVASTSYGYYARNGNKYAAGVGSAYGSAYDSSNTIGVALDLVGNTVTFYRDNVSQGAISISANTYFPYTTDQSTTDYTNINFGQQPFTYTPPSGYQALCTANLATPTIANGAGYMAATTYTGTGATQTIANTVNSASFKPDFVWIKSRSAATNNNLFDSVRTATKYLISNSTAAEATDANSLTAFASNGFTLGSDASSIGVNVNTATYVGWQWLGSNTTVSNTSGSVTSTVCVNTTSGFSVLTYTGTGANATVGHGLGVAPGMVIVKQRTAASTTNWAVWHTSIANTNYLLLNTTAASTSGTTYWNSTTPTSTVFSIGSAGDTNTNTGTYVAYCFAPIAGYSAFGSYTGNGSSNGPFVYLGFRPRWVLIKRTDSTSDWYIWDTARDTYNVVTNTLLADTAGAETSATSIDDLSNGFKCRSSTVVNASSGTYIYAAFAENPFNYSLAR
jgi:hypothetical protein